MVEFITRASRHSLENSANCHGLLQVFETATCGPFSLRPRGGFKFGYGYRYGEVPLPGIGRAKNGTRVTLRPVADPNQRSVVQCSLGCSVFGASLPHADPHHQSTVVGSIFKRVASCPLKRDQQLFRKFGNFVDEWISKNLQPIPNSADVSFETWIAGTYYPLQRKNQLREVYERLQVSDAPHSLRNSRVLAFVKDESYPSFKHARSIYARVDEFKVMVGPMFKLMESQLYSRPEFIKHVAVSDRARYITEHLQAAGATYMATDYTAFESHFDAELLRTCEFKFYRHMVRDCGTLIPIEAYYEKVVSGINRCKFRSVLAEIPASRMSGEMSTSLGNGFTNLMVFLFIMQELGLKGTACVIEGDDCLARIFPGDISIERIKSYYERLGFHIKLELHVNLNEASFCGLVFDPDVMINLPDPIKKIMKLGWISSKFKNASIKTRTELLRGKAMSLMAEARGCPVLQELAVSVMRLTSKFHWRIDDYWLRAMVANSDRTVLEVDFKSRVLVEKVYGILIEDQYSIESYFRSLTDLGELNHPILSAYIKDEWLFYDSCYTSYVEDSHFSPPLPYQNNYFDYFDNLLE